MKRYLFRIITLVCVKMMIPSFLFAGTVFNANAQKITLVYEQVELHKILEEVKRLTSYDFIYKPENIDGGKKVSLDIREENLEPALKKIFDPMGISMRIESQVIMLQKGQQEEISKRVLKGKVLDEDKNPLPGVNVFITGTTIGALTDMNGEFQIGVPGNVTSITFSFIGMKSVEYSLKEVDWSKPVKIIMKNEVATLDEVVVTGMERVERQKMTGSVATATAKDLRHQGITSIDQILEGMVAGLNSTSVSGAPGTRAQITIRGENNLSGRTEPLWIVDGLPLLSGVPQDNTGDYVGTVMQDGVGNIMPEDIESITILKDASATAIYGARAANGVIVIETKKGFRSKLQFNYSGTYNVAIAPRMKMDFMNSREKLEYEANVLDYVGLNYADNLGRGGRLRRQLYEGKLTPGDYQSSVADLGSRSTNWFKEIFRTAHSQMHNLSLRGGTEEMTYYTSFNFQNKNGILLPNRYSSAGVLVRLDYRPVKNLIIGVDVNASTRKNEDHASAVDPFNYAMFANPYERPYDENGNYAADLTYLPNNISHASSSGYKYDRFNILRELNETRNTQKGLDFSLTFNLKYNILDGLAIESIVRKGLSYNTSMKEIHPGTYTSYLYERFAPVVFPNSENYPDVYDNGELSESSGHNNNWSVRNQIDYSFDVKGGHSFTFLVANEVSSKKFNNFGYSSPIYDQVYRITGLPVFTEDVSYEDLRGILNGLFNTSDGQDRTVSFLGTARYSYKDRYVLNFNYRADGADVIGEDNRFTPLWSIGGRYNLHKEKFFENNILTEFSLRGSYGYTGNIDRTAYPFSTIEFSSGIYEGNHYVSNFSFPNPSVKWEKKMDRNVGVDLSFFKGRINFTADYYNNRTDDVLEYLTVPLSTGRRNVKSNGGVVTNKGLELFLNIRWIQTSDITFSTSANVARNKNIIKRSLYTYNSYEEAISRSNNRGGVVNVTGKETGSVYGWKSAGVDPNSGNPMFQLTEDGKRAFAKFLDGWEDLYAKGQFINGGVVTSFDQIPDALPFIKDLNRMQTDYFNPSMQYLGRTNPLFVGGFNTFFKYKNLEFTTQWTFKTGHIIESFSDLKNAPGKKSYKSGVTNDIIVSGTNRERKYLEFWQGAGDRTNISRFVTTEDYWSGMVTSDDYEKGDYLRLSNLSLSYRLPSSLVKQMRLTNMTLSFNARNLLTFTKYKGLDVGSGGAFTYPVSREFNLKLSVGF